MEGKHNSTNTNTPKPNLIPKPTSGPKKFTMSEEIEHVLWLNEIPLEKSANYPKNQNPRSHP
jgi:hypothetical protein